MNYQFAFLFLLSCMLHLGLYSVHGQFCLGSEFTTNGTYQANLNSLLSSLSSNVTLNTRFYNATAGGNPDKIFGFLLCRGDVTLEACHVCANTSTKETQQKCPNNKETILWDNDCLLWYSNRDIFLTMEESPFAIWNPNNVTDPNRFKQILEDLINDLAKQAAFSSSTSMFATGEANFTSSQKIYGLVQCIPIISQNNCNRCLVGVLADMPNGFNQRQGGRLLRPSCYVQFENYLFYKLNADTSVSSSLLPPLPPLLQPLTNTTLTEGKGGISFRTVIIIVIPTVIAITFLSILCFFLRRRKPKDKANGVGEIISMESLQFDFETIKVATDNFSDANKLGQGGFGAVYKGWLFNGQEIAVKRLSRISRQGEVEFMNEVVLVAKLQHRNLVRLLGFCLEREDKLLIYEFMPNTSLDHFIFDPIKRSQLDWERRYKIIKGIARGLLYLHEDSRLKIIHRDLKPNNILLDGELNPRISDFGMARLFEVDQTQDNASRIVGTYGYMAPEYAMHGRFSVKSDVFSFGVLLLEIVSGQKNNTFCQSELAENLLSYAWRQWREGMALELMDSTFRDNCLRNEVMRCIHIGLLCVQENVADRPTMTSVVLMLNSNSVTLPLPSSPAYFVHSRMDQSTRNPTPRSVNDVSITELSPR